MLLSIHESTAKDFQQIWPIFQEIVAKGDTYPYPPDINQEEAFHQWMEIPQKTFVAKLDEEIVGTYYIKPNQTGLGAHVCNCGYMVSSQARGQGIATQLCVHSQQSALELGYKAMQFNLVVSSNAAAVHLWNKLGFEIIGRLPKAFNHLRLGLVDAFIMYKWLTDE